MLRVGFNAYLLHAAGLRGWNRYAVNLLAALPAHDVRPVLYSTKPLHPEHLARLPEGTFEVRVAPPMRYVRWEQRWLPLQCRVDGVDLLHSPFNCGLPVCCPVPRVLTLHDAIDALHDVSRLSFARRWSPSNLRSRLDRRLARQVAAHVITVSEHAKRDLVDGLRLPAPKVTVVYEAADPTFEAPISEGSRTAVRARYDLRRPFVFYVGGLESRKNVPFLVRAFADAHLADVDLVLAGGTAAEGLDVTRLAAELGVGERVRTLGYVPDADLAVLYAEALGLAYPSAYEGFGLPLVEAMAVGCPVLAARATSLPEVLGAGGETFALGDPAELATWLRRLATEPALRADLVARARRRACDFSWRRAAAATVEVYRRVLAPRPAPVR